MKTKYHSLTLVGDSSLGVFPGRDLLWLKPENRRNMGTLSKKPWNLQSAASSSTLKVSTNPVDWYQNLQDAPGDNLQGWVSQGFSSESIYGDHGGSLMLGVLGPMLRTATTDKKDKRTEGMRIVSPKFIGVILLMGRG